MYVGNGWFRQPITRIYIKFELNILMYTCYRWLLLRPTLSAIPMFLTSDYYLTTHVLHKLWMKLFILTLFLYQFMYHTIIMSAVRDITHENWSILFPIHRIKYLLYLFVLFICGVNNKANTNNKLISIGNNRCKYIN